ISGARRYPLGRVLLSVLLAGVLVSAVPDTWRSLRTLRAPVPGTYAGSLEAKLAASVARYTDFERARARVASLHGILFVKYPLTAGDFSEYPIINPGLGTGTDLPVIVAVDLGTRNRELLAEYPGRPG